MHEVPVQSTIQGPAEGWEHFPVVVHKSERWVGRQHVLVGLELRKLPHIAILVKLLLVLLEPVLIILLLVWLIVWLIVLELILALIVLIPRDDLTLVLVRFNILRGGNNIKGIWFTVPESFADSSIRDCHILSIVCLLKNIDYPIVKSVS